MPFAGKTCFKKQLRVLSIVIPCNTTGSVSRIEPSSLDKKAKVLLLHHGVMLYCLLKLGWQQLTLRLWRSCSCKRCWRDFPHISSLIVCPTSWSHRSRRTPLDWADQSGDRSGINLNFCYSFVIVGHLRSANKSM